MKKGVPVIVLIASIVLAVCLTAFLTVYTLVVSGWRIHGDEKSKIAQKTAEIEQILDTYFVEDYDEVLLGDAAAGAMLFATGDQWSYYVPASEYAAYEETSTNSYSGVGIMIQDEGLAEGFTVTSVTEDGPAWECGVQVGDLLHQVEGKNAVSLGIDGARERVRGEEGTSVSVTFLRNGESYTVQMQRRKIEMDVVSSQLLEENTGYIWIKNFDAHSAEQTKAEVETLLAQGAQSLVFDVRFNPGGHRNELVEILDYLLPEGVVFQDTLYDGTSSQDMSDADCIDLPMAVLVNAQSYSAAEFFAAALQEYEWAVIVGEQTVGKGRYQYPFTLSDGSAVSVSIGRYYTPSGKSLEGVGIAPDIPVSVTQEQAAALYSATLAQEDDPQLQAALSALLEETRTEIS